MDNFDMFMSLYILYVSYLIYESLSDDEDTESEHEMHEMDEESEVPEVPPMRERPIVRKTTIIRRPVKRKAAKKKETNEKKRKRTVWVKEVNLDRNVSGYFVKTFEAIKENSPEEFFQHTRMTRDQYDRLLNMVKNDLTKKSMRPAIGFECRLAITLSYLSQGLTHQHLAETFKAGKSSIREIILETSSVIWNTLSPLFVSQPTPEEYINIADDFYQRLGIPNCIGAVDEKYFNISCPPRKGVHKDLSMTFMAISDSTYCFTSVGIELYGTENEESTFTTKFLNNELALPDDSILPNSDIIFPYYFVGNSNFPLKRHIMRPYPGKLIDERQTLFNRNLSKVQRALENSTGVLVARWKVLQTLLHYLPENAKMIFLATIALHNYIRKTSLPDDRYCPEYYVDWEDDDGNLHLGEWRNEVHNYFRSGKIGSNNASKNSIALRDQLSEYLVAEDRTKLSEIGQAVEAIFSEC